jgi:TRAP-type C4-dicarboxylate transport system permease small subunit
MRFLLAHLDDAIEVVERGVIVLLFSALVLLISFNIFSRNLLHVSYQSLLELSPALVLWLALIGSTLAMKKERHIKLEILLRFCPASIRRAARVATSLFGLGVMGVLSFSSLEFVTNEISLFGGAGYVAVIFPVFFILVSFRYGVRLITHLFGPFPGTEKGSGGG